MVASNANETSTVVLKIDLQFKKPGKGKFYYLWNVTYFSLVHTVISCEDRQVQGWLLANPEQVVKIVIPRAYYEVVNKL